MSADPSPKTKPTVLIAARDAQGFKSLMSGLMLLFVALVLIMTVGHAVAPSLIGAAPAGLWRAASIFATGWFVFNGLWALFSHLGRTLALSLVEVFGVWFASVIDAYVRACTAPQQSSSSPSDLPPSNVSYLAELLAQKHGVKPTDQV